MTEPATIYAEMGRRIRAARLKAGLTQSDLSAAVSLTRTSITNIEGGRQKVLVHTLVAIAAALKVPPSELLDGVGGVSDDPGGWGELLKGRPRIEQEWIKAALNLGTKGR